ncbi:MAG: prephenate dehydratase [Planctomycetaceae bacterium]|nr:prephenate dehydratase [Planctomycetaceae bacterium]
MTALPQVAYLGPIYSYSYLASQEHFGKSTEFVPVNTIASVFEAMQSSIATYGVVPLENSTDGRIVDTLNILATADIAISAEINYAIHHNLIANCKLSEIRKVYSKPQALSQCRGWIDANLPDVSVFGAASSAEAAQIIATADNSSTHNDAAAIASTAAAEHFGVQVIAASIQDITSNVTRFAVLGTDIQSPTGDDKTLLLLELDHCPGALADVMSVFKTEGINLTWIESFPRPNAPNEYVFFIEFVGHQNEQPARNAIESLQRYTRTVRVLGTYPRATVTGVPIH